MVAHSFARARLQQDYHAARELVRTFVPAGQRECVPDLRPALICNKALTRSRSTSSTAQQALLHLALIEYEDGGFEAAQLVRSLVLLNISTSSTD